MNETRRWATTTGTVYCMPPAKGDLCWEIPLKRLSIARVVIVRSWEGGGQRGEETLFFFCSFYIFYFFVFPPGQAGVRGVGGES